MTLTHIVILAIVQGLTEFLPISSWGHLVILQKYGGWPESYGLVMEVAVHVGSLGAVMVYFWRDLWLILGGLAQVMLGRFDSGARLVLNLIIATIPAVVVGYLLKDLVTDSLRTITVIGWATLIGGIVLFIGDRLGMTIRNIEHMRWGSALVIGLAQVCALIPGASRSGMTMTAARFLGFERRDCARFSFLMSIPVIIGAGLLTGLDLYKAGDVVITGQAALAAGLAFVTAFIAIAFMMVWLRNARFTPFVVYRLLLGGAMLYTVYFDPDLVTRLLGQ